MPNNLQEALNEALVEIDTAGKGNASEPTTAEEAVIPDESQTPPTEQGAPAEQAPQPQPPAEQEIVGEAAIRAAQELGRAKAENEQLKQALAQMQAAQQQASQLNEQKVDAAINAKPTLDFNAFNYMTDDEREKAQAKYTDDMTSYILKNVEERFGTQIRPVIESHQRAEREAKETSVLNAMAQLPNMNGFSEKLAQIRDIGNMPEFAEMQPEKKYALAYLVALGRDAVNAKPKNAQQIYSEAEKNPDVMKMLEAKRVKSMDGSENLPRFAASSGAASAPVYTEKAPQNLDDAREQSFRLLDLVTKKKEK